MNPQMLQGLQQFGMMGRNAAPNPDAPVADTAETVHISSLALLKMLKHGTFELLFRCSIFIST